MSFGLFSIFFQVSQQIWFEWNSWYLFCLCWVRPLVIFVEFFNKDSDDFFRASCMLNWVYVSHEFQSLLSKLRTQKILKNKKPFIMIFKPFECLKQIWNFTFLLVWTWFFFMWCPCLKFSSLHVKLCIQIFQIMFWAWQLCCLGLDHI